MNVDAVRCLNCGHLVALDERRLTGCLCDPDAPTWIALTRDGALLKGSASRFEIEKSNEEGRQ